VQFEQMLDHQIANDDAIDQRIVTADITLDPPIGAQRQEAVRSRFVADIARHRAADLQSLLERHVAGQRDIAGNQAGELIDGNFRRGLFLVEHFYSSVLMGFLLLAKEGEVRLQSLDLRGQLGDAPEQLLLRRLGLLALQSTLLE